MGERLQSLKVFNGDGKREKGGTGVTHKTSGKKGGAGRAPPFFLSGRGKGGKGKKAVCAFPGKAEAEREKGGKVAPAAGLIVAKKKKKKKRTTGLKPRSSANGGWKHCKREER